MLSEYQKKQIALIKEWKSEEPSVVTLAIGKALTPLTWAIQKIVPYAALQGALDFSSSAAQWLTDTNDILRDAGVRTVDALKHHDLEKSDILADEVHNWAIGLAAAEGALAGTAGFPGLIVDMPLTITLALRTIHKIGICYGFEVKTKEDRDFVYGILAASGANDMTEKLAALSTLRTIEVMITKQTWKKMAEVAAANQFSKEAAIISIKGLAKQLGINLTKRKALQSIPFIGAVIGASANGWYIKEVGWAARHAFQERWLIENHKIIEIEPSL